MNILEEKFKEVCISILPITAVIILAAIFILDAPWEMTALFFLCVIFVVVGFTIFLAGVDVGINPMGSSIGKEIPKRKSKLFMIAIIFIISFLVTVAEPDVTVFANQVHALFSSIDVSVLTYSIAIGVALFLIAAALKIVYKLSLKAMMTVSYVVVIALSLYLAFTNNLSFLSIAYDSGGVTTGPVTVPVLLAIGIGICSIGKDRNKMDGFGMIGLASVGPIIALLVVGIFMGTDVSNIVSGSVEDTEYISWELIGEKALESTISVIMALVPLTIFFIIFQKLFLRYSWQAVSDMIKGVAFAGIGIIIFLTGVYSGFMPTATAIGQKLIDQDINGFIIVGFGFLLGFLVAFAEPAVSILGGQVQDASKGAMSKRTIILLVSCGVALFVAIGMMRIVSGFSLLYIVIPGYIITLILMWLADDDIIGIAFDAGGVATGPMSVAILSAMYVGIASAMYEGTEAVINGFGLIALIALAPCFFICLMNVYTKYKNKIIEEKSVHGH